MIVAIGGLSGSGKSTIAAAFAESCKKNVEVIRSDVLRKQYFNVPETEKLPAEAYTSDISAIVYQQLFSRAKASDADIVILDAVFLKETERQAALATANDSNNFKGFWVETSNAIAEARINDRENDASDANVCVRQKQQSYLADNPIKGWYILNGDHTIESNILLIRQLT